MSRATNLGYYEDLWGSMEILPGWRGMVRAAAARIDSNREGLYAPAERATGVPWIVPGMLHELESGCRAECQILNGQRWDRKTTIVPKGLGPWESWLSSAVAGLARFRFGKYKAWTPGLVGLRLEPFNGMGYADHGKNSPYLWSGSNHGVGTGKYVGDGVYDPDAVSRQVGVMVLLRALVERGSVTNETWGEREVEVGVDDKHLGQEDRVLTYGLRGPFVAAFQRAFNENGSGLVVDGVAGPKTAAAFLAQTGRWMVGDPKAPQTAGIDA